MKNKKNRLVSRWALMSLVAIFTLSNKYSVKAINKDKMVIISDEEKVVDVDVLMVGDVLVHKPVYTSGIQPDGTLNYDHLFADIDEDIDDAEIAIVNQETILGGTELGISSYPCFNSPQEIGDAEAKAGFNTVLHATNHALDKGLPAIENTLTFWKNNYPNINVLGLNETEADVDKICVYDQDGFKIAILNYTFSTNGISLPKSKPYVVNMLSEERVTKDVNKAKMMADMVIVCPHWGTEYQYTPDSLQEKYTKLFSDLGVDVVIGTHPHVLEPVNVIKNAEGHEMVVYYSLGNFVSCQTEKPRMIGGMAKITLEKKDNEAYIKEYSLEPLVTQEGEYTTYKLSDYDDILASKNKIRNHAGCSDFNMAYINGLCEQILGDQYRPEDYILEGTISRKRTLK